MLICSHRIVFVFGMLMLMSASQLLAAGKQYFPEEEIPRFNIPRMTTPPTIDGVIDDAEWKQAVRVMGMATAHNNTYRGRPHVFWVSWDAGHIYIAGRAHVLKDHVLLKSRREKFTTQTVFDDSFEFGLSMEGRNQSPGEAPSFFKFIVNSLKSGEYLKMYPSIGQYLYNWRPELQMQTRVYEASGAKWFDIEIALDLADLEMPVENQAGDLMRILLAHDGKNPGWQWTCVPSASGYLVHDGYPRAVLTDGSPYVQVEQLDGFDDEKLNLRSVIHNPGDTPVTVAVNLTVANEKWRGNADITPVIGVAIEKQINIPAGDSVRFDVDEAFSNFIYGGHPEKKRNSMRGAFDWQVTLVGDSEAPPVYAYHLKFAKDEEKKHLQYNSKPQIFNMAAKYNPVSHKIWIEADTLDAQLPEGTKAAGASWRLTQGDKTIADGRISKFIYHKYQDLIQLPALAPGDYEVEVSLIDDAGKALVSRNKKISKKDEAAEYPEWWGKKFGNPEQLLKPFEPLRAQGNKVNVTRRTFELDSLGLPIQIQANDGDVLTDSARIVLVIDGKTYRVPTKPSIRVTEKKGWRVSFEGNATEIAGVRFNATGMIEQDGLVSLEMTYQPTGKPVRIQELRIEWPVDDTWHNHMACMGVGGNYSARFIDAVPAGQGEVWSSLKHIGKAGSGMTLGNFYQNLWLGTEKRGFLWYGTTDEGWVPNDRTAAHTIMRDRTTTIVRNHIVSTYPGDKPFELSNSRTIRFSYNASPFKKLTKGWRINQRSAANGFTQKPKYKWNWDTGVQYFSVLSPPFPARDRWAEYYAHCKEVAEKLTKQYGLYSPGWRMRPYLTNQIALRGYMRKSLESKIYNYFSADWETSDSGETLNETYRDYMMWLQHRQVTEGGCRHFYYDISMCGRVSREIAAGFGYILPDGRIQPSGTDWTLRKWYIRANALMQDNGLYPTGISGHATQTIPLIALPFSDAILDSEFPMDDPIDVYPSARMIALSHPQTFGCNINHLGFMNPDWAGMHDAGMGGGHGSVFDRAAWRNWGIERDDVEFVPYWRNGHAVRRIGDGLICSMWKRPGSIILGILNYGPDKKGYEKSRPAELTLDLTALGVPQDARHEMVRVRELAGGQMYSEKYYDQLKWYQDLPGTPNKYNKSRIEKFRQKVQPQLDLSTGALTGFDVQYHDIHYVVIHWEQQPISDGAWAAELADYRGRALDWGINTATDISGTGTVKTATDGFQLRAWQKSGSVMVLITNDSDKKNVVEVDIDLDALGLRIARDKIWHDFTSIFSLDGGAVRNVLWNEEYQKKRRHEYTRGGLVYDGHVGKVVGMIPPGTSRLICVDKF